MDEVMIALPENMSEEDVALLEQMALAAKAMQDEKEQAFQAVAEDIEATLRKRIGTRATKETEWTTAQDLYLGKLAASKAQYMFPENDTQRASNNSQEKYRVNIVRPKIEAIVSQMCSAQFGSGEKNWALVPPKVPDIDTNVDTELAMQRMENVIEDQLEETNYIREVKKAIEDWAILGTGILKGPINAGRLKKIWAQEQDPMTGEIVRRPQMIPEYVPCIKRVDPWFFYPDTTVSCIEDASDAIELHPMSKRDLQRLLKHPGYIAENIQKVLEEAPKDVIASRHAPAYTFLNSELFKDKYLVIERHGPLDRDCLCKMGVELPFSDERETFWSEVWVCNGQVIRIELSNLETADSVPYAVDVYEEDPSNIFGFGLPLLVEDQQLISDGIWNAVVMNAKLTSGPQVGINRAMIQPMKDGSHDIEPWKVWSINEYGANIQQALQFYEVPNRQEELAAVLQMAKGFADEEASIPPLLGGNEAPQLSAGATGAAMVFKNATSMLHSRAQQWDDRMTDPSIGWMYDWNMQYNKDETIKGAYEVDVRSSTAYLRQHMEMINLEKLINQSSQNPDLAKVVKLDECAKALVTSLQLPSGKLVRTTAEIKEYEEKQQQNQPPDPKVLEAQIKQGQLEIEKQRLELEKQKLQLEQAKIQNAMQIQQQQFAMDQQKAQFEAGLNQQRHQMEYEQKQEANDARIAEANASVLKAQLERDVALTNLAARQQTDQAKLQAQINIKDRDQQIKEFEIGVRTEIDANDQALKAKEMQLRRDTGQGI